MSAETDRTVVDELAGLTKAGSLWTAGDGTTAVCTCCAHRCVIPAGKTGACRVRWNDSGTLRVPWGYVASLACDPIEKKPLFHVLPGRDVLSFGMLGCNLHCRFCQNWRISQVGRDPAAGTAPRAMSAQDIVDAARRLGAPVIASTYNEPLVSTEWAVDIFTRATSCGILTACVSNGMATAASLDLLCPVLDAANIDLKCFSEAGYARLGGRLAPVLETIERLSGDCWIEVTTLVVPGFNDREEELRAIASFLVSIRPDIPWHVSAYHRAYRVETGAQHTPSHTLKRAAAIGRDAGLRYIYTGNVGGRDRSESTACPHCRDAVVERQRFRIIRNRMCEDGLCPACGTPIAGIWGS